MHVLAERPSSHPCGAVWPTDGPEHTCGRINIHPATHMCPCGATIERGKAYPPQTNNQK